jgi:D-sedoheptulose 7-phosphate isomerase
VTIAHLLRRVDAAVQYLGDAMFNGNSANYFSKLTKSVSQIDTKSFDNGVKLVNDAWQRGAQIITLGNGGSSTTALHFITDWSKMVYMKHGIPFRGRSLLDNIGLLMAYSNDVAFADVFREQLKNIMVPGDLVIAISGSGNSENVIRAIDYANANGAVTLGLSGFSGGRLRENAQHNIWVASDDMQICEDLHSMFGHIVMQTLCGLLEPEI